MVPLIVKQSVEMKARRNISILIGNYEYYYAVGLVSERIHLNEEHLTEPMQFEQDVKDAVHNYTPNEEDAIEKYLIYLVERYEAEEEFNDDMKNLYFDGVEKTKEGTPYL